MEKHVKYGLLPMYSNYKYILISSWDNIYGPIIDMLWTNSNTFNNTSALNKSYNNMEAENENENEIELNKLNYLCRQSLESEIYRTDEECDMEIKFTSFTSYNFIMSSIVFSSLIASKDSNNINTSNIDSTSTRYSLSFISTLDQIDDLLNINTAVENNLKLAASHLQALLNRKSEISRIFYYMGELFIDIASQFYALINSTLPHVNFESTFLNSSNNDRFISTAITSHLQTEYTVVIGDNENYINRMIKTLSIFLVDKSKCRYVSSYLSKQHSELFDFSTYSAKSPKFDGMVPYLNRFVPGMILQGLIVQSNSVEDYESQCKRLYNDSILSLGPATLIVLESVHKVDNEGVKLVDTNVCSGIVMQCALTPVFDRFRKQYLDTIIEHLLWWESACDFSLFNFYLNEYGRVLRRDGANYNSNTILQVGLPMNYSTFHYQLNMNESFIQNFNSPCEFVLKMVTQLYQLPLPLRESFIIQSLTSIDFKVASLIDDFTGYKLGKPSYRVVQASLLPDIHINASKVFQTEEKNDDLKFYASLAEKRQPGLLQALYGDPQALNRKVIQMLADF